MLLTAIAVLILIALIVISRDIGALRNEVESVSKALICSECHGSGHNRDADDPEERCELCFGSGTTIGEMNRWVAQTGGRLDGIHNTILELWACPTCHGTGRESSLDHLNDPAWNPMEPCKTCKGAGRRS
jgi:DnaJ-class molecular chaperone